jgi:hypothetical protein
MYIVAQIVGCIVLAVSLAYTRDVGFGLKSYAVYVAAEVVIIGWLFAYSYGKAPNLYTPWFIGTGCMVVFGLLLSHYWFGDVITIKNYVGIGTVVIGSILVIT